MCVSVKTGDEWPGGSGVFHFTRLVGPKSTGRFFADDTPVPFGPRKRTQFSAALADAPSATTVATDAHTRFICMRNPRKSRRIRQLAGLLQTNATAVRSRRPHGTGPESRSAREDVMSSLSIF